MPEFRSDVWMIAAVARNGVIGAGNDIPWHLPADMKRFKTLTVGHPVIMGRRTYESIREPLPRRHNIVLTRSAMHIPGVTTAASPAEALSIARDGPMYGPGGIAIIGGAAIYAAFMDEASRLELTIVESDPPGDTFFPPFDAARWRRVSDESGGTTLRYRFVTLERRMWDGSAQAAGTDAQASSIRSTRWPSSIDHLAPPTSE